MDAILNPENSNTPVEELTLEMLYDMATQLEPLLASCNEFVSPKITNDLSSMFSPAYGNTVTAPPPLFLITTNLPCLPTAV